MASPTVAPYGSWRSPITPALVASARVALSDVTISGDDVYWLEGRALEGGRSVVVRRSAGGEVADVTPPEFNVRTLVHEYGGGSFWVRNGAVFFVNFSDQRLYRRGDDTDADADGIQGGLHYPALPTNATALLHDIVTLSTVNTCPGAT